MPRTVKPSLRPSAQAAVKPAAKTRRTWRRRAEARPGEILDAALGEFIGQGFDAARMDDIAARAGLSKGAIYLYFSGKEALLRGLIEREVKPVFQRAATLAAAGAADPKATLRAIALVIAAAMADGRRAAIPFLVVSVCNRFPDIAEFYRREVVEHGRAALEGLIAKGVAMGQFRAVDPAVAARAFIGPMMFEVIWTHVLKGAGELGAPGAWIEAQLDVLMRGLETEARV